MPVVLPPEPCPRWLSPDRVLLDCRADVLASVQTGSLVRGADEAGSTSSEDGCPEHLPDPRRDAEAEREGRVEPERTPAPRARPV